MRSLCGWVEDDLAAALKVYREHSYCEIQQDAQTFFEAGFKLGDARSTHFTGYYEIALEARWDETPEFGVPLLGYPADISPMPSRSEIVAGALERSAECLAWLKDPLDAFFLQVQGSGQLHFPDGSKRGIGYAGKNGHPYRSIGAELVDRGVARAENMSPDVIRAYCQANPDKTAALLNINPSYVFFQLRDAATGPIGAMGIPVTALRSIAVDPDHIVLGSPVWVELEMDGRPLRQLMIAQDVGSAIKGAGRADIFCGTGDVAGQVAGRLNTRGKMIPLVPVSGLEK